MRLTRAKPLRLLLLLLALASVVCLLRRDAACAAERRAGTGRATEAARGRRCRQGSCLRFLERLALRPCRSRSAPGRSLSTRFPLGIGTGFFVSPDGLVLTAYHVVDPGPAFAGEERLVARGPDGQRYPLELVGFDAFLDLALLQAVGAEDVPYLPLESRELTVGSNVVAIGNSRNDFLEAVRASCAGSTSRR